VECVGDKLKWHPFLLYSVAVVTAIADVEQAAIDIDIESAQLPKLAPDSTPAACL